MASTGSGVEIERKFLVGDPPAEIERHEGTDIRQGYLVIAEDGSEARVRERGDEMTLTVKRGEGRVRAEEEVNLDRDAFERLWRLTEGRRIEKTRHVIEHGELEIEVDVYAGNLDGLVVAEVEFPTEEAADEFEPPAWFGRELTCDKRYNSQQLAVEGRPPPSGEG